MYLKSNLYIYIYFYLYTSYADVRFLCFGILNAFQIPLGEGLGCEVPYLLGTTCLDDFADGLVSI